MCAPTRRALDRHCVSASSHLKSESRMQSWRLMSTPLSHLSRAYFLSLPLSSPRPSLPLALSSTPTHSFACTSCLPGHPCRRDVVQRGAEHAPVSTRHSTCTSTGASRRGASVGNARGCGTRGGKVIPCPRRQSDSVTCHPCPKDSTSASGASAKGRRIVGSWVSDRNMGVGGGASPSGVDRGGEEGVRVHGAESVRSGG